MCKFKHSTIAHFRFLEDKIHGLSKKEYSDGVRIDVGSNANRDEENKRSDEDCDDISAQDTQRSGGEEEGPAATTESRQGASSEDPAAQNEELRLAGLF